MEKTKKSPKRYATFGQFISELQKFDQDDLACIIASTDRGSADGGKNFVDRAGVKSVNIIDYYAAGQVVKIVCSDKGTMTYGGIVDSLRRHITLASADEPAAVWIGYRESDIEDANDEPCVPHLVKKCNVFFKNDAWNVELGPVI